MVPSIALGVALISPILESLTGPFGVSSTAIGQMVSVYVAPGIVVVPVTGLLADRYGRKPLVVFPLMIFGVAGTAIAFTTDFQVVLGLRFLQGLGFATLSPMTITALGDLYSGAREATAQGIRFTTVGIAQAAIPPIGGALVVLGWQYPFFLYALTVPIGFAVWLWFEEPTSIGSEAVDADGASDPFGGQSQLRALVGLSTRPRVLSVLLARQVPTFAWYAVLTYNSILVVQVLGGSPGLAGTLIAASSVAKAAAATQLGRATAFFDRRVDLLLVVHVVLGVGLVVSGFAPRSRGWAWASCSWAPASSGGPSPSGRRRSRRYRPSTSPSDSKAPQSRAYSTTALGRIIDPLEGTKSDLDLTISCVAMFPGGGTGA